MRESKTANHFVKYMVRNLSVSQSQLQKQVRGISKTLNRMTCNLNDSAPMQRATSDGSQCSQGSASSESSLEQRIRCSPTSQGSLRQKLRAQPAKPVQPESRTAAEVRHQLSGSIGSDLALGRDQYKDDQDVKQCEPSCEEPVEPLFLHSGYRRLDSALETMRGRHRAQAPAKVAAGTHACTFG